MRWCREAHAVRGLRSVPILLVAVGALVACARSQTPAAPGQHAPRAVAYVDERACAGCHPAEYRRWTGSHHARAMQRADATTVLGDFNDARFRSFGVTTRFFTRGGKFLVNTEGPDGRPADFEIAYTLGVEPLQQYLVAFPGGRLQSLTIAWDTRRKRWFTLSPDERPAPGSLLHWTGRYQNWNLMCAECHTTNLSKGYDMRTDSYDTTWTALGVGCQSCHGPGAAHLAWAAGAGGGGPAGTDVGLLVRTRAGGARAEVDRCARCHSRRTRIVRHEEPWRPFLDEERPEVLRSGLYLADGQQWGEVYEYGSFRQSRMYAAGVRCTDCHDPHNGAPKAAGDAVCTRCHGKSPDPRFPRLTSKAYDAPAHHFHRPGSAGARCVSCHMPARTYMEVDPRRDHSMRVPRPDLSVKLGTPNACTTCHADRSAAWAADAVERWYGRNASGGSRYAEALAAGREGARDAALELIGLASDAAHPAIVRATALLLLRRYGSSGVQAMITGTRDEDPVVRAAAVEGLDRLPAGERIAAAAPLLKDPIRAVRIAAAQTLSSVPPAQLPISERPAFDAALGELEAAQVAMADMPSARLNLGVVHERLGRPDLAEQDYGAAARMDPALTPAVTNLAALYSAEGRNAEAERLLREAIAREPAQGELRYSLGLLLSEDGRGIEAVAELTEAARLLPRSARAQYNLGLALERLGRRREGEAALLKADALDPADVDVVYALAVFYAKQDEYDRAVTYARRLGALLPADPGARRLLDRLERAARNE
jgi:Flp pilus assembly protein TadD